MSRITQVNTSAAVLENLAEATARVEQGFTEENTRELHKVIAAQFANVPYKSGALKRSLTQPKDRAHVWEVEPRIVRIGTSIDHAWQAQYARGSSKDNPKELAINEELIAEAIADALLGGLFGGD